jgi:hypothetical protein
MARDISFFQYLRAHGNTAGPAQRPLLTGAVSAFIAFFPYEAVLWVAGARASIAKEFGIGAWVSSMINVVILVFAGVVYAAIFKRAANDRSGGWIFGASYGFVLWLIAPISIWQLSSSRGLVVGTAAMGLFAAYILFGSVLGVIFPWINSLIQSKLDRTNVQRINASANLFRGG